MTANELLGILLRRWYVVSAGLVCTIVAFLFLSDSARVYAAQSDVVFVAPGNGAIRGLDDGFAETLIDFAGVVGTRVNDGRPALKLSSPSATLFGTGVREGVSIALADGGGQWGHSFNRPVLSVQIVDSSAEEVESILTDVVLDIGATAQELQIESGADRDDFITIETVPEAIEITSVGQTRTSVAKGFVALSAVGAGLTCAVAVWWDRTASRARRRKASHAGA